MLICIWEATTGSLLTKDNVGVRLTSLEASADGNKIFVGSEGGAIRIYDVCNRCLPRLVKIHKFYKTEISKITISHDQRIVAAMSKGNNEICFFYQGEKNEFEFMCYARVQGLVQDICWNTTNKESRLIGITQNSLLFSMRIMVGGIENIREPIPDDVCFPMYSKIDSGCYMIDSDPESGDIYITGEDRYFKNYALPTESHDQIDWTKPAPAPVEEFKTHGISTTCVAFSNEANFIASGGKDGALILRNRNRLNQSSEIKSHSIFTGGIKAI
jgi:WD40 repeat protein